MAGRPPVTCGAGAAAAAATIRRHSTRSLPPAGICPSGRDTFLGKMKELRGAPAKAAKPAKAPHHFSGFSTFGFSSALRISDAPPVRIAPDGYFWRGVDGSDSNGSANYS